VAIRDGFEIRRAAVERRIPCLTSLDTAAALVESLNLLALDGAYEIKTLQEYVGTVPDRGGQGENPPGQPEGALLERAGDPGYGGTEEAVMEVRA
jgi:carbamoyl-phosphate synthase large subunit